MKLAIECAKFLSGDSEHAVSLSTPVGIPAKLEPERVEPRRVRLLVSTELNHSGLVSSQLEAGLLEPIGLSPLTFDYCAEVRAPLGADISPSYSNSIFPQNPIQLAIAPQRRVPSPDVYSVILNPNCDDCCELFTAPSPDAIEDLAITTPRPNSAPTPIGNDAPSRTEPASC